MTTVSARTDKMTELSKLAKNLSKKFLANLIDAIQPGRKQKCQASADLAKSPGPDQLGGQIS
jgi:hypothetical protein